MLKELERIHLLKPYLKQKREDIERANAGLGDDNQLPLNGRTLTNLGTFRAYVETYLAENSNLRDDLIVMVRQLPPTAKGLPLEVYSFASDIDLVKYECIQADIFDHLLAAVPFFGLRVFQNPSGHDFSSLKGENKQSSLESTLGIKRISE
jgi:miniconductance mechanosensitive channel